MVDARNSDSHTLVTHLNNAFSFSVTLTVFSVTISVKPKKNTEILTLVEYCKMLSPKFHRNT